MSNGSTGITIPASSIGAGTVMGMQNYGATQPGLLSQVGGWVGQNPALAMGIGALGMSAFGRASTGAAPSARVELTKKGKELETSLYESIKTDLFPENLASRFIGKAKKAVQVQQRLSRRMIQGATAPGPDRAVSGNIARAFLTQTQAGLKGVQEGPRQVGEAKRTFALNRMTKLQNFMNLQMQTPVLRAEAELINQELAQYRGAQRGAALGGIAQLLATSYAYGGRR